MEAIPLAEATTRSWDTIVVGAGPAGATAARRLAQGGQRVVLVDRHPMPRGKVCGCCLSPAAVGELAALDTAAEPGHGPLAGAPLAGVRLAAGGRSVRIPLAGGWVVSREWLDTALVRAALRTAVAWLPAATVTAVHDDGPSGHRDRGSPLAVELRMDGGSAVMLRGRRVILATGLSDRVRVPADGSGVGSRRTSFPGSRIGVGAVVPATGATATHPALGGLPAGELLMAVAADGYCGIVRLEDGRIDVAAAIARDALRRAASPAAAVAAVLDAALGGPAGIPVEAAAWRATPPLSGAAPLVAGVSQSIFRIGDAAGYVEPFTGEGIGWALASGRLVATAILEAPNARAAAARYVRDHAAHFGPRHARCRRVARSLRRPRLVQAAVRAAGLWPWAARRLAPLLAGHGTMGTDSPARTQRVRARMTGGAR